MQAVILAGGLATRMQPYTRTTPKAMLVVAGRPFIDWQLEKIASCGFSEVLLCIAHLGEVIRAHVGDGGKHGLCVEYADEGPTLLGTGGALRRALDLLRSEFLVTYGDSYLPFDYAAPLRQLQTHPDCDGVMAVYRNAGQWDASNVVTDGTWVLRYQKGVDDPAFDSIDYGATALRREVIAALPANEKVGLEVVQQRLAASQRLRAEVARERFFEIGSPAGLQELDDKLASAASA